MNLYSFVFLALCCWVFTYVSDSADKRAELRRKRAKGGSKDFTIARRQPSEGIGQGSGSGQGRAHRAASKQPVVEASDDSEEEYDLQDDAYYDNPNVDEEDEEEEEVSSPEQAIPGGRDFRNMPLAKWTKPELWAERQSHPYAAATGIGMDPRFKNEFQQRVYHKLLMTKSKKFAPHKQVNTESLRDNDHLYPGVYSALGRLGLILFVTFNHPYNEDLVMQFFATLYFSNDFAHILTWMFGTHRCSAPMEKFFEIIPYPFMDVEAVSDEFGIVRENGQCTKDEIAFAYKQEKSFVTGSIEDLLPLYDTMRHIMRYTLTPKAEDSHNIRSSMLDVFLYLHQKKKVDVLDFM